MIPFYSFLSVEMLVEQCAGMVIVAQHLVCVAPGAVAIRMEQAGAASVQQLLLVESFELSPP